MKGEEFKDDFRKALPRQLVLELTRHSPWRATAAVLEDVAVIGATLAIALHYWPNPLAIVIAVIVVGTRGRGGGVTSSASRSRRRSRRWSP